MNPERLTQRRPPWLDATHETGTPAWLSLPTNTPVVCTAIGANTFVTKSLPSTREMRSAARAPSSSGSPSRHDGSWPVGAAQV